MLNTAEPKMVTYLHQKGIREKLPVSGTFELTQRCNFNCEMCYVHDLKIKNDPISAEQWLDMGEQAKNAGMVFLLLTGGEPLIRDDFEEIYLGLMKKGFIISINSNGSLLHKHLELFKKYPPSRINISLYGSDAEAYKSLCKVDRFSRVLSNIKLMKENSIPVKINCVLTPANAHCYKKIIDITKEIGVQIKPTAYAYPQIRLGKAEESDETRLTPEKAAEYSFKTDKYRFEDSYFKLRAENMLSLPEGFHENTVRCRAGRATFWITADGEMRPCGMMPEPTAYPFRDGFNTAWQQILKATSEIRLPEECLSCKYAGICSVCAAMCKAETGRFDGKPEYVCRMTKRIYELTKKDAEEQADEN